MVTPSSKRVRIVGALVLLAIAAWLVASFAFGFSAVDLTLRLVDGGMGTYMSVFFAAVGLRYAALICFSFMEHIDNLLYDKGQPDERDDDMLPFISIVIPAYNEGVLIQSSIRSLLAVDYPNYEILVVDDGSTDDTYACAMEIARAEQRVRIRVFTKPNGGKSDALNVGMARAHGEFILNMDGDTLLNSQALRKCIRHFDDPQIGAVAGNIKVYNRENLLTCMQSLEYIEGLAMARKAQSYARVCNVIPGPLGMFRKAALMQVCGYDHDTFAEDCDLTLKLLRVGWHIAYEPAAIAWVETPSRVLDLIKQRYRWSRGVLQAIVKHKDNLWNPRKGGINFFILWGMLFENIIWPVTNVMSNLVFIYIGIQYGVLLLLLYWWLQLTLLDIIAAIYCVTVEREDISIVFLAPFFRIFYILFVDVVKVLANLEEFLGLKMTWGKLQREGKI